MKILHLSTYDLFGGASRAAYRLHRALAAAGHDATQKNRGRTTLLSFPYE